MDSFMCTLCSRKYSSSKTFEKHIRRCQDKRKLACPECHKEVIGQVQLDDHRRSHRGVDCNLCGERIPAKCFAFCYLLQKLATRNSRNISTYFPVFHFKMLTQI